MNYSILHKKLIKKTTHNQSMIYRLFTYSPSEEPFHKRTVSRDLPVTVQDGELPKSL